MSMFGDDREDMNYVYQLLEEMAEKVGKPQAVKNMLTILEAFMVYHMDAD